MIIGLVGVAGSGKDTVAKYMSQYMRDVFLAIDFKKAYSEPEEYQYGGSLRYIHGFSDALKQVIAILEGRGAMWDNKPKEFFRAFYTPTGKEETIPGFNKTRRQILQEVGQGMRDTMGPDTWVNTVVSRYLTAMNVWRDGQSMTKPQYRPFVDLEPFCVVPDVRYSNEIEAIENLNGRVFYIKREINPVYDRMSPLERSHSSVPAENIWNLPVIENQHDLAWLSRRSQDVVRQFLLDSVDRSLLLGQRLDRILT